MEEEEVILTARRSARKPLAAVSTAAILLARRGPVERRRVCSERAEATLPPLALTLVMVMAPSALAEMSTTFELARPEYLGEWRLVRLPWGR